jgi:sterol desaturase/sphingolipid hydroxylase (fatty acid hydroxylase superfamily)
MFGLHDKLVAGPVELLVLQVLLFLGYETGGFVWHYAAHKNPILWELHKVHHSAMYLVPITASRLHPLELIFQKSLEGFFMSVPAGIAMAFYNVSPAELLLLAGSILFLQIALFTHLQHAPTPISFGPLDRIFISPHMHQFHHSSIYEEWDKNFGNTISIFDWMIGSAVIPPRNTPIKCGIGRGEAVDLEYQSLYGSYVKPLISMVRVALGRRSPHELITPASLQPDVQAPPPPEPVFEPVSHGSDAPVTILKHAG